MMSKNETIYEKDGSKKLKVSREFEAPVGQIWKAWTDANILDQWWAPEPWKTRTKTMDFREGGHWLYAMEGPGGEVHWSRADYHTVEPEKRYTGIDMFCDIDGNPTKDLPLMHWDVKFNPTNSGTLVTVELEFDSEEDLQKIVEMGFKEGFAAAHSNLDKILSTAVVS